MVSPRKMSWPPSVTINAGTPIYAIHNPCQTPMTKPAIKDNMIAIQTGMSILRMKIADSAADETHDRAD